MKKLIGYLIVIIILLLLIFSNDISVAFNHYYENKYFIPTTLVNNEYSRNYNFNYVQLTNNFFPNNKQDILNIYYTFINSGMDEFTFYCKSDYENCYNDVDDIADNQVIVSNINNFVHPYNSFKNIETNIQNYLFIKGKKITIKNNKNYDDNMISIINTKVKNTIDDNIKYNLNDKDKIKIIHDYIINNTKYDSERSDQNTINYKSDTAYGTLVEGHSICSGYADAMMLFLEKLNIKNYKISSKNHGWNYVYLDGKWYNLDLTWDDPVSKDGKDVLEYNFFLINDDELLKLDKIEHTFDKTVYSE